MGVIPISHQLENRFLLGAFGPIFRAPAIASLDAVCIQDSTHDVVTHTRQVLHATATDQHYRVFLQVMPFARNVSRYLKAIGQTNAGDFTKGRVRFFGSSGFDLRADTSFLRTSPALGGTAAA